MDQQKTECQEWSKVKCEKFMEGEKLQNQHTLAHTISIVDWHVSAIQQQQNTNNKNTKRANDERERNKNVSTFRNKSKYLYFKQNVFGLCCCCHIRMIKNENRNMLKTQTHSLIHTHTCNSQVEKQEYQQHRRNKYPSNLQNGTL